MPTLSENITQVISDFDSIKTAIENTGVEVGNVPTSEYSEYVTKAYDKGVADNEQARYNAFWDMYQENGLRTRYDEGFYGWNLSQFKPKYNIKPQRAYMMFYNFNRYLEDVDLVDLCNKLGITFDTSILDNCGMMFANSAIVRLGTISTTYMGNIENLFNGATRLVTIEKLIFISGGFQTNQNMFDQCEKLANINKIEGKMGRTVSFSYSPLTVDTAKRVINALVNYAGKSEALTYKLTLKSTVWEALNEAEAPPTGETWQEYVQSLGWLYA